jgi:hypothetical protein
MLAGWMAAWACLCLSMCLSDPMADGDGRWACGLACCLALLWVWAVQACGSAGDLQSAMHEGELRSSDDTARVASLCVVCGDAGTAMRDS